MTNKCNICGRTTRSLIKTENGPVCLNCYSSHKSKKKHRNEEAQIQSEFFKQVRILFPKLPSKLLFAVPNGGSRNIIEARNMKYQGVVPGVADVILLIPQHGYASLCLEFKTAKGIQSDEQKEFQRQVEACGSKYVVVKSTIQAIKIIKKYLV